MRSPRSVTIAPMLWPSRSLKFAIDLRALRTSGFWPVIAVSSSVAFSSSFGFWVAAPMPMFTTILASRGTCIALVYPNSCESLGTISER
jgi:hypothetical protein